MLVSGRASGTEEEEDAKDDIAMQKRAQCLSSRWAQSLSLESGRHHFKIEIHGDPVRRCVLTAVQRMCMPVSLSTACLRCFAGCICGCFAAVLGFKAYEGAAGMVPTVGRHSPWRAPTPAWSLEAHENHVLLRNRTRFSSCDRPPLRSRRVAFCHS